MSYSILRSVSPIHLEYLRNMEVYASMSISLLHEGRLWGLIACHHYSPRFVPFDVRTACELMGQVMSLTLGILNDRQRERDRQDTLQAGREIVENVIRHDDTAKALIDSEPNMLKFIEADGGAVVLGNTVVRIGQTSGRDEILAISLTAYARPDDRRRAILAGFQAHISKPVEAGELLAVVASLTGRV